MDSRKMESRKMDSNEMDSKDKLNQLRLKKDTGEIDQDEFDEKVKEIIEEEPEIDTEKFTVITGDVEPIDKMFLPFGIVSGAICVICGTVFGWSSLFIIVPLLVAVFAVYMTLT